MVETLVPIVAITVPFIFVAIVTVIKSRETRDRNRLRAELYTKALEKGDKISREEIEKLLPLPLAKRQSSLKTGVILLSLGIGISLCAWLSGIFPSVTTSIATGLIPLCMGLGFMVLSFFGKKSNLKNEE